MKPPKLRAHANVHDLAEERRLREGGLTDDMGFQVLFVDPPPPPRPRSHPAAQALLAGLAQGMGERENDPALIDAGKQLAATARNAPPAAPERRQQAGWLRRLLGFAKRGRPS